MNRYFSLDSADLVVPNMDAWGLLMDFHALKQIVETVPGNTVCVVLSLLALSFSLGFMLLDLCTISPSAN